VLRLAWPIAACVDLRATAESNVGSIKSDRAIEQRDKAIAHARSEYAATLVAIVALEQDLRGKESSRRKTISSCIESLIPKDRPFTTMDAAASLEALDNARVWRTRSIDRHISRLREKRLC
jgi:hypothetical protein